MRVRPSSDHLLKSTHFAGVTVVLLLYLHTVLFNTAEILQNVSMSEETEMMLEFKT